jgi:hypothetical protein
MQGEADFGIQRDARLLSAGDGRADFWLPSGLSGDWKVARKAYNLLMESGRPHADLLVAGLWYEKGAECWIEWLGWERASLLEQVEPCDFGYGVINHYCPVDQLQPMSRFRSLLQEGSGADVCGCGEALTLAGSRTEGACLECRLSPA